jgi:hypothetical protein
MNRERDAHDHFPALVPAASGRRLSSHIGRAFRGGVGAKTGLRTIVRSVAAEMLAAGATEGSVMRALGACVRNHPARIGRDVQSLISGKSHSTILIELADECIADVARPDCDDGKTRGSA